MKYSLVGCISTVVYFLCVFIMVEFFEEDPLLASAISFIIMTIISFMLNKKYTFVSDFSHSRLMRFFIAAFIGFILNFIIMFIIVKVLSLHYTIGELVTTLIIPLINFTLNNYWTFK
ncbi:GtrA family protein [Bacillus dakarensis]|uniref:GtrA family protein n=1 Tax=Robertmurraya dakarensis TaxID=1926278 RepID=UPI00098249C3|nr:GtrA family protein [Bacillus dakarensis]